MICLICNEQFNGYRGLSSHVKRIHKISSQEYYDRYLRNYSKDDGFCRVCGKETNFISIRKKYNLCCSLSCAAKFDKNIEKRKTTLLKNYGVDSPIKSKEIKNKIKNSLIKNYGVDSPLKSKEILTKTKTTLLKNYGVDSPIKSKEIKNKIKNSLIKNYGVDSPLKSKEILTKFKSTKIKNNYCGNKNNKPLFNFYAHKINWIEEVRRSPKDNDVLEVRCKKCGGWFIPDPISLYNRIAALKNQRGFAQHNLYCSDNCKQTCSIFGKHLYQEGQNPNSDRPWHSEWALEVKRIANYECEICGSRESLESHHIQPVKTHPYLQADIDNGICLCKECHMKYGHKDECSTGNLARKIC